MPDTIQNASTSHQPSTLPANGERRSPDAPRPGCARPTGLPILSTEPLTTAERKKLLDLTWTYRCAALQIEMCLRIGRVDVALETLQSLERDIGTLPAEIARTLGSNR